MSDPEAGGEIGGAGNGPSVWADRRTEIRRRFERLVERYDGANRLLSFGWDEAWRRRAARAAAASSGDGLWVDLASGTGAMARALAREGIGRILRCDLSPVLLADRFKLAGCPDAARFAAESHRLPLAGGSASGLVMAFATRHIPSVDAFLEEAHRVLRPGGRLILLDMDLGRGRFWGPLYRSYFRKVLPSVAAALTGQGETYRWMVRTVEEGPGPESLVPALRRLGFDGIDVRHPTGGAVYLIVARSGDRGRREDAPASSGASGGGAIVSRSESAVE